MGHTLIARFEQTAFQPVETLIMQESPFGINKIPFGRNCDREKANRVLPFHMTVFHWKKEDDGKYLERLNAYRFRPFHITVTGAHIMHAGEQSALVYFSVMPGEGYLPFQAELEAKLNERLPLNGLHITAAVTKNRQEAEALLKILRDKLVFPFSLPVSRLELYHIWRPVELKRTFSAGAASEM